MYFFTRWRTRHADTPETFHLLSYLSAYHKYLAHFHNTFMLHVINIKDFQLFRSWINSRALPEQNFDEKLSVQRTT